MLICGLLPDADMLQLLRIVKRRPKRRHMSGWAVPRLSLRRRLHSDRWTMSLGFCILRRAAGEGREGRAFLEVYSGEASNLERGQVPRGRNFNLGTYVNIYTPT